MSFSDDFQELTGNPPFPWQESLYERFIAHCGATLRVANEQPPNNIPSTCNLPTGLGKTSVVAIWLIALANHPDRMPRRLVYVVNRRTVVDQTTTEVEKLRERLGNSPRLKELRQRLVDLCALPLDDHKDEPLAISALRGCEEFIVVRRSASQTHDAERRATLRGQFADNGEWHSDPARPAVIVGTNGMTGRRLLFRSYDAEMKHQICLPTEINVFDEFSELTNQGDCNDSVDSQNRSGRCLWNCCRVSMRDGVSTGRRAGGQGVSADLCG